MSDVRVRFAPSPTGLLHIGGARTALFNWLYARHTGGTFVLRVEDTDRARNTDEAVGIIFEGMKWLGLDWDEGPHPDGSQRGERGPYFQSQRDGIYQRYIQKLKDKDLLYEDEGALRFRSPKTPCVVKDLICGEVPFDRAEENDPVIVRSDGSPVFHLVNVVDDLEMGITHVIRGEDHLSNTPRHIALYEAFEVEPPAFAHIPLILNQNGSKMSKRDEGSSIGQYMESGYVPEAVVNYLCLLGWSPKEDREIMALDEIIERFDLPQINRSNAKFDLDKLKWMNYEYWRNLDEAALLDTAKEVLASAGMLAVPPSDDDLCAALATVKEKVKVASELPEWMEPYLVEEFDYEAEAVAKAFRSPESIGYLRELRQRYGALDPFTAEATEAALKALASEKGVKAGPLVHPCRVAVSGRKVGASLYHMLEVLGRERVLARMDRTLRKLEAGELAAP